MIGLLVWILVANAGGDSLAQAVVEAPRADSLRGWHDRLGNEPHVAGSEGDARVIATIAEAFEAMGLQTDVWAFDALLPEPVRASVRIVGDQAKPDSKVRARRGIVSLAVSERELLADPATSHPDLDWGWNAFSGSGVVEAEVVYVNKGRKEDFATLKALGVDLVGKIALARYGGNYRGFKAKFAEAAGAIGLLMYLDPGDYGFGRGKTWPNGGWANDTCIQRGSILTLPYKGDPLTPFVASQAGAERLALEDVPLPTIPVQPIGYAAAERIMAKMTGRAVEDDAWKGGMRATYRIEGGPMRVRLEVEQRRDVRSTANVIGILPGAEAPEQLVIVGCHHDAWGFGAADPLAGTIVLMETARVFAEEAKRGVRPRRTIIFAAWGAEEFGIIGSSEWCEGHRAVLARNAVAYVNLDMAAMGNNFSASATPPLQEAIRRAAGMVPQAGDAAGRSVLDVWGNHGAPTMGTPGGGSDHVGFNCHLGIPACSLHGGGSAGTAYHSNYDTLAWYRATVGESYESALMMSRVCSALVADLADSPVVPLDLREVVVELHRVVPRLKLRAEHARLAGEFTSLETAVVELAGTVAEVWPLVGTVGVDHPARAKVNELLIGLERAWTDDEGLPGRPWFRNLYCTSDRDSGYGAVVLPLIDEAIDDRDPQALSRALLRVVERVNALQRDVERVSEAITTSR
jgi:N-acetylated-alpha-linked acidic dipeptidase